VGGVEVVAAGGGLGAVAKFGHASVMIGPRSAVPNVRRSVADSF
jgi:hypothetical protein